MKDINELIQYMKNVRADPKKLNLDYIRNELIELYHLNANTDYGRNILALQIALSDKQLKTLNEEQIVAFDTAVHAVNGDDPDRLREELGVLDGVGLCTFIPKGYKAPIKGPEDTEETDDTDTLDTKLDNG